jgi:hypothetical protein
MFPKELWEQMSQEIRVFAEVVPVNVNIEIGQRSCFLKVRCAAYLVD